MVAGEKMPLCWRGRQRTIRLSPHSLGFLRWRGGTLPLDTDKGIFTIVKIKDPDARRAAVRLLRRGTITVSEAASMAGVSRQVVRYWCAVAGVEIGKARSIAIAKAWRRAIGGR